MVVAAERLASDCVQRAHSRRVGQRIGQHGLAVAYGGDVVRPEMGERSGNHGTEVLVATGGSVEQDVKLEVARERDRVQRGRCCVVEGAVGMQQVRSHRASLCLSWAKVRPRFSASARA